MSRDQFASSAAASFSVLLYASNKLLIKKTIEYVYLSHAW